MKDGTPSHKMLQQAIDTEKYRTDTSTLLAYDKGNNKFLFRALNSNYFLQDDADEIMEVLDMDEAENVYESMPTKHITNIVAAFPKYHGGIGMDTDTNLYDE